MKQSVNHAVQAFLTFLQGLNIATVPDKFVKYVVLAITLGQWYVANLASKSDPVTGAKLKP